MDNASAAYQLQQVVGCPCCDNALQRLKASLVDFSRHVSQELPTSLGFSLAAPLSRVRAEGKALLSDIGVALSAGRLIREPDTFAVAVHDFAEAVDQLVASGGLRGLDELTVNRIYAMRRGFPAFLRSVNDLRQELSQQPPNLDNRAAGS